MVPIANLSPQLQRIEANLSGAWLLRWERNIWQGTVSCQEQFVILILVRLATDLLWAKSLPSKNNSLELSFALYPISQTEPHFQVHFSAGAGAFIQQVTARLVDRDHRPPILAPSDFETGVVIPFASFLPRQDFSFACFVKSDVVVRRSYVWGLKPRFLEGLDSPWREMLARGRSGVAPGQAAA
jgi:hypothetical protein